MDLTLCCPDSSRVSPSVKAGASVYLANKIINHERIVTWIISLSYTLGCRMRDIKACAVMFAKHLLGVEKNKLQVCFQLMSHCVTEPVDKRANDSVCSMFGQPHKLSFDHDNHELFPTITVCNSFQIYTNVFTCTTNSFFSPI